jgi:hypothetical protein
MENLKQGTKVKFDIQTLKGEGIIVGLAANDQPIIGKMYIIEPDEKITNEVYNYTHFAAWECQFKIIS